MEAIKQFIKENGLGAMYYYHKGQLYFCPNHWKYLRKEDYIRARLGKFKNLGLTYIYISSNDQLKTLCK